MASDRARALPEPGEFMAMVEHLPVLCWMADPQGYIYYYNRKWYEYTGTRPAEMAGWGWQAVHDQGELPNVMERWRRALATGAPFEMTFPLRGADGIFRPFLTRAVPHWSANGEIVHWFGTNTDITELQDAEAKARDSARTLQSVIDEVPALVYVKDLTGKLELANAAVFRLLSETRQGPKATGPLHWFNEAQAKCSEDSDRRAIELGETQEVEEQARYDEQGPRVLLTRKSPFKDGTGRVVGVIGTSIDITERKRAEQSRAESEALLRLVLDQLFAFVGLMTLDGILIAANQAPLQAAGLLPKDVLGKYFWETYWWSYAEDVQARIQSATLAAAKGETRRFDVPVRIARGELVTIDFQIAPLRNADGVITHLVPSAVVIEERVRLEQARILLIRELHHRVKNLFAIAVGMVNMSARSARDVRDFADTLVDRLLALASAHELIAPSFDKETEQADATTTIDRLIGSVLEPHIRDPAQVTISGPPLLVGPSSITSLCLILHELATNASKYGALSTQQGRVEIVWEKAEDKFLRLTWSEHDGPAIVNPSEKKGFGSQLMALSAKGQLGGNIRIDLSPHGLRATLTALLDRLPR
jgi:PAS domain S-box-containing protein